MEANYIIGRRIVKGNRLVIATVQFFPYEGPFSLPFLSL